MHDPQLGNFKNFKTLRELCRKHWQIVYCMTDLVAKGNLYLENLFSTSYNFQITASTSKLKNQFLSLKVNFGSNKNCAIRIYLCSTYTQKFQNFWNLRIGYHPSLVLQSCLLKRNFSFVWIWFKYFQRQIIFYGGRFGGK